MRIKDVKGKNYGKQKKARARNNLCRQLSNVDGKKSNEEVIMMAKEVRGKGVRTRIGYNKISAEEGYWIWMEKDKWFFSKKKERRRGTK